RWCFGYVLDPALQVLDKPDRSARPVGNYKFRALDWIAVVEPSPRPEAPEWVRARTLTRPDRPALGWARHHQLVLATDFRRGVGCGPIASLNWHRPEAGDGAEADFQLRFTESGEVRELGIGNKPISTNYAVHYDRGIFVIWDLSDEDGDLEVIGK